MDNVSADFTIQENQPLQAEYTLGESEHFDCSFELFATGTAWGLITGNLEDQTDLWNVLSSKADTETVEQNLSAIEDEISDLSDTVDNNYTTLVNRLENDELAISNNSGEITSINNTIQSYGDIVTYNASSFATSAQGALADTALQSGDNISELVNNVGYITSASLPTLEDLTTQAQLDAINSGATTSKINQITSNTQAISTETTNRQNADNNLQAQIDAITASSDVTDIVGTYAQLQAYDTSTLPPNSIIKVLQDEHQNDETTYYRWVITGGVGAWVLIGEEGPYYTKSEADGRFVPQTRTINGKDLSNNISLDASDVGALPSSTVIPIVNNGTLDIQVNGTSVGTFTANQSGNTTANIIVPDSATWGNITGDIADQTDLQTEFNNKQDVLVAGTDLEIVVGSGTSTTVTGTGSVTLSNAAANSLSSVIIYGKCSQTGTPTTSNPIDILCNNGVIKYNTDTGTFYADGTIETVTDSLGNIATAEMLFGFGDYVDTQNLLGGSGTRKVGLMVLTGTEDFDTATLSNCYSLTNALGSGNLTDRTVYCTHFRNSSTLPAAANRQGYALIGNKSNPSSSYTVGFGATSQFSTVALFKSWLATQYANGTPVIIAYPLTTSTQFSATAQTLTTTAGNNQLTITQSAINNLNIKATYTTDSISTINFTNDTGYITGIDSSDVTDALGYTPVNPSSLATVATTGSYNDLTDKPYIPSGVVVDQTFDPTSTNAQSGVAINGAGFLTGITSSDVTTALGYTPYNNSNPNGYTSNVGTVTSVNNVQPVNGNVTITIPTVPTNVSAFTNDAGYITSSALSGYVPVSANSQTISATSGDFVINSYYSFQLNDTINGTQPLLYDSSDEQLSLFKASGSPAVASLEGNIQNGNLTLNVEGDFNINTIDTGATAYVNYSKIVTESDIDQTFDGTSSNPQSGVAIANAGFLTGITSSDVTTALGYTPYNSSNPSGYITSSDLPTNHVTTDTDQNITGTKTFVGQKKIAFKQSSSSDKLGFTLYNNSGTEKGYLEYNPSNTVDSVPLMTLGNYASASGGLTHVGFRKYSSISGASGAYNLLAPLISDAKTPFSLTTTYTNFYMPLGFTDGNTTVKTAKSGLVDLSSILPTVNNSTITFTQGGVTKGTITLNQASNSTIDFDASSSGGIQNTATGTDSLTIMGTPTAGESCINIGVGSQTSSYTSNVAIGAEYDTDAGANARGDYGVSIGTASIADENAVSLGYHAQATGVTSTAIGSGTVASGSSSVSVGKGAETTAQRAIQIGEGTNSTASSLKVGFGTSATNYQLLDGTTGLIPDARISSNIARTSQIPTVPTNISAFTNDSGYITGITSSDVTTALGYTPYNSTNPNGYITGVTSSDIITALGYTPANNTLSNLGATASTNFDGEWVVKNVTIAASATWDSTTDDATYSIANQLPNDNYEYEVLITGLATSAATAGRFMTIQIRSDVQTSNVYVCSARSLSSIQNQTAGAVLIRVGAARTITQYSSTATTANGTYSLYLKGYRRVGTNT